MVAGAIRTDFILSAEIMAIALAEVADRAAGVRGGILALVAVAITVGVYGAVGLIVKMDDVGLHLAERRNPGARALGRGLVHAMPKVMAALSTIGIAAMIWVGGGIIVHGLAAFGVEGPDISFMTLRSRPPTPCPRSTAWSNGLSAPPALACWGSRWARQWCWCFTSSRARRQRPSPSKFCPQGKALAGHGFFGYVSRRCATFRRPKAVMRFARRGGSGQGTGVRK